MNGVGVCGDGAAPAGGVGGGAGFFLGLPATRFFAIGFFAFGFFAAVAREFAVRLRATVVAFRVVLTGVFFFDRVVAGFFATWTCLRKAVVQEACLSRAPQSPDCLQSGRGANRLVARDEREVEIARRGDDEAVERIAREAQLVGIEALCGVEGMRLERRVAE